MSESSSTPSPSSAAASARTPSPPAAVDGPKPTVIRNSFLALGAGCMTGAVVGAYKQLPPGPTAAGMGSMWGAIGFTYFLSRAQLSKFLAEADTDKPAPVQPTPGSVTRRTITRPPPPATLHDRHTLLASVGAGAFTGSVSTLLVYGRRPRVLLPATLLAAASAGIAQSAYTWARHTRQDLLLWKYQANGANVEAAVTSQGGEHKQTQQQQQPMWDALVNTKWMPVRPLTDDEYLVSLNGQVAQVEAEVAKYERVMGKLQERIRELEEAEREK
ncbi:hypothetical protein BCR44DRAFT_1502434 [Catenaria anguillulae PL171]|uniref:Uncharacterized protein n=1 Tax=Catenaria anguillulae PL171 TaxID=765915 RepID=A0A1Y2HDZ5_9FUNG|nr:hypothetical protein BCR44DRAFT_1502434 [Catenaria anguillulae PL171]